MGCTADLPRGLRYCTALQAAPEKSLRHLCITLQTDTRSHHKLGIAFEQIHATGSWSTAGVRHRLSHRALPRAILSAQASTQCQPGRTGAGCLQRCLWACLHTVFSSRSGESTKTNPIPCYGTEPELIGL